MARRHGPGRGAVLSPYRVRRIAREVALRALYAVEQGQATARTAVETALEAFEDEELRAELGEGGDLDAAGREIVTRYAGALADGAWRARAKLDGELRGLVHRYDYDRLAAVDRAILRLGAFELDGMPFVPPSVTLDEAVELAKKYSTAESSKFVNGVLGAYLRGSAKAEWRAEAAPPDPDLPAMERVRPREEEPEIAQVVVAAESEEAELGRKFGSWSLRAEDGA